MSKRNLLLTLIALFIAVQLSPAVSAFEVGVSGPDYYLLLVIDGSSPYSKSWAEPVVLSHNKANKIVVADSLDCNKRYSVGNDQVKMGDIYSIGGEALVISVINSEFGLDIKKFAKTTYSGLGHIAKIMGGSLDTQAMINASKSNDRSATRREQLKFMAAVSGGLHSLNLERIFSLISASFTYFVSNISLTEAYGLASDIMGGTFIPHDGRNLSIKIQTPSL